MKLRWEKSWEGQTADSALSRDGFWLLTYDRYENPNDRWSLFWRDDARGENIWIMGEGFRTSKEAKAVAARIEASGRRPREVDGFHVTGD